MSVDIKKVAKLSGVSISTVSRVLNDFEHVDPETRKLVEKVIAESGYRKNSIASNLRKRKSMSVGLIVPDISNEFFATLAKMIEKILHENQYSLLLCNTDEDKSNEAFYLKSLLENKVRSIILVSAGLENHKQLLENCELPVIFVDRIYYDIKLDNFVSVESDNYQGGKLATNLLIDKGSKKLLFLCDERARYSQKLREEGFITTVLNRKIEPDNYKTLSINGIPGYVREKIKEIYSEYPFDGLFCSNDKIAIGALKGLRELNIDIPRQVQVIGFDGTEFGALFNPSLSTIKQDIAKLGTIAGQKCIEMMTQEIKFNERIVIPVSFVERESTL